MANAGREAIRNDLDADLVFTLVSGGLFDLLSLDTLDADGTVTTNGQFRVTGSNGANTLVAGGSFGTIAFGSLFMSISSFTISHVSGQQVFDDIEFAEVGEPAVVGLFGLGLAGIGVAARRRNRRTDAIRDHVRRRRVRAELLRHLDDSIRDDEELGRLLAR